MRFFFRMLKWMGLEKKSVLGLLMSLFCLQGWAWDDRETVVDGKKVITATTRIQLDRFPNAFNPSIFKTEEGLLLLFRYCPDLEHQPSVSQIGIVLLNDRLQPISEPELLPTRAPDSPTPSQSEDARLFSYRGRIFLIYNDGIETYGFYGRRDMFIAELLYEDGHFTLSSPLKLVYGSKHHTQWCQKNWLPFEWNNTLLMIYSINPHEILRPNLYDGSCYFFHETHAPLDWAHGTLRGSSPPQLVDGEYLAFFHSGIVTSSPASRHWDLWHYFMGAYTFSASPPFAITKISPAPLMAEGFYTTSSHPKRVIFPGGFAVMDSTIYLAYGKDDAEIWIATLDKEALIRSLRNCR